MRTRDVDRAMEQSRGQFACMLARAVKLSEAESLPSMAKAQAPALSTQQLSKIIISNMKIEIFLYTG